VDSGEDTPARGVGADEVQGPEGLQENRFARAYREIVRRNAATVAHWQAYGFMNGVLNTDNTSVAGLSIDFGPFAFMDTFDPAYTPNHDDEGLRYSYRNQPTVIWWNLVRLGEALGELIGAAGRVDEEGFVKEGFAEGELKAVAARAEGIIMRAGEEYKGVFLAEYRRLMAARLGLKEFREGDFEPLFSEALDMMEALKLDFNHFFRRLGEVNLAELETEEQRRSAAGIFFHSEGPPDDEGAARGRIAKWLDKWRRRAGEGWGGQDGDGDGDARRREAMRRVNPNFVPRGWVLEEVIRRVEDKGDRQVLQRVMRMATNPFETRWDGQRLEGEERAWEGDADEEWRWTGDVPRGRRLMQCSCSS
jgi:uncharacterized protein YdiU (UPF0061 family)